MPIPISQPFNVNAPTLIQDNSEQAVVKMLSSWAEQSQKAYAEKAVVNAQAIGMGEGRRAGEAGQVAPQYADTEAGRAAQLTADNAYYLQSKANADAQLTALKEKWVRGDYGKDSSKFAADVEAAREGWNKFLPPRVLDKFGSDLGKMFDDTSEAVIMERAKIDREEHQAKTINAATVMMNETVNEVRRGNLGAAVEAFKPDGNLMSLLNDPLLSAEQKNKLLEDFHLNVEVAQQISDFDRAPDKRAYIQSLRDRMTKPPKDTLIDVTKQQTIINSLESRLNEEERANTEREVYEFAAKYDAFANGKALTYDEKRKWVLDNVPREKSNLIGEVFTAIDQSATAKEKERKIADAESATKLVENAVAASGSAKTAKEQQIAFDAQVAQLKKDNPLLADEIDKQAKLIQADMKLKVDVDENKALNPFWTSFYKQGANRRREAEAFLATAEGRALPEEKQRQIWNMVESWEKGNEADRERNENKMSVDQWARYREIMMLPADQLPAVKTETENLADWAKREIIAKQSLINQGAFDVQNDTVMRQVVEGDPSFKKLSPDKQGMFLNFVQREIAGLPPEFNAAQRKKAVEDAVSKAKIAVTKERDWIWDTTVPQYQVPEAERERIIPTIVKESDFPTIPRAAIVAVENAVRLQNPGASNEVIKQITTEFLNKKAGK